MVVKYKVCIFNKNRSIALGKYLRREKKISPQKNRSNDSTMLTEAFGKCRKVNAFFKYQSHYGPRVLTIVSIEVW